MDVAAWLRGLGLERYINAFSANKVDEDRLLHLSADDLKDIGVASVGHRRRLLEAIIKLEGRVGTYKKTAHLETFGAPILLRRASAALGTPERRQITIMFCDFAAATESSSKIDPGQLNNVRHQFRGVVSAESQRNGGFVVRLMENGVLTYFGYPEAHENHAELAVLAALAIRTAVCNLPSVAGRRPQVRIGIETGLVVVGDDGDLHGAHNLGIGETINLASRAQSAAKPGSILVAEGARRLIGRLFECNTLPPATVKGYAEQVQFWEIIREVGFSSRFEALRSTQVPFVGREGELDHLSSLWRRAKAGSGQVLSIAGDPGIGKSRLVHALRQSLTDQPCTTLLYQCSEHHTNSALSPILGQFEFAANITVRDAPVERLAKLETLLDLGPSTGWPLVPLIAESMGIDTVDRYPALPFGAQERKARLLAGLVEQLIQLARAKPVLMIVEDAHWADPTTCELIDQVMARLEKSPIFLVITIRPGKGPLANLDLPPEGKLTLAGLGRTPCAQIAASVASDKALPVEIINMILERTEGVPLFVEELTRTVLASSLCVEHEQHFELRQPVSSPGIPTTLQDSLTARLDLTGASRTIAQLGSVIGRTFGYDLLCEVADAGTADVDQDLQNLVEAELLTVDSRGAEVFYSFKHALIQEAAYASLLHSRRRELHQRVAAALEKRLHGPVDGLPEVLAHHLTCADKLAEAACQWHRAGTVASGRSANVEAAAHFQMALATLDRLAPPQRNRRLEFDILISLAGGLRATRGYAAEEVGRASRRALEAAHELGNDTCELQALNSLYSFYLVSSQYTLAGQTAETLLAGAIRANEATYVMIAHRAVGAVAFHTAQLKDAAQSLQQALALYDVEQHAHLATLYGADHAETCACFLSLTRWTLGEERQAVELQSWAVEHARALNHAHTIAQAHAYRSLLFCLVGDAQRAVTDGYSALTVSIDHGLRQMEWFTRCILAVAQTVTEPGAATADLLKEAMGRLDGIAPNALQPFFLSVAADHHRRLGAIAKGLQMVNDADAIIQRTSEFWAQAEVQRVRGRLFADSDRLDQAEACYRDAIQTATAQSAFGWVRRTMIDLDRLLGRSGRTHKADAALDAEAE